MRTAIDTNVLSALWSKEPFAQDIARRLGIANMEGAALVSAPVYAELLAHPSITVFLNSFLEDTGIEMDFDLPQATWLQAGRRRFAAL